MAEAELPRYRILNYPGFFGPDDTLYPPDTEILFDGVPNEEMLPLNDAAKQRMIAYVKGLNDAHRSNMTERGLSPDIKRPTGLGEAIDVEAQVTKKIQIANASAGAVPQMGNLNKNKKTDAVIEAVPASQRQKAKPVPILSAMNQSDAS